MLSSESVDEATSIQTFEAHSVAERESKDTFYGYGWSVDRDGVFAHGGSDGTFAWVDPNREIVGIVFTQSPGGKIPREQFRRVVNASIYEE